MQKIIVHIEGMMCVNCAKHVVESVKKVSGVKSVEASHENKQAVITAKDGVKIEDIKQAVTELGYSVTDVSVEEAEKKGLFGRLKK